MFGNLYFGSMIPLNSDILRNLSHNLQRRIPTILTVHCPRRMALVAKLDVSLSRKSALVEFQHGKNDSEIEHSLRQGVILSGSITFVLLNGKRGYIEEYEDIRTPLRVEEGKTFGRY
ncbi:hypothetical protein Agabi119p4_8589 [Agaricus bisporus var. burnettii]|uniref:Uncharacterized protein n=1 Tax=Agaricus bisporus var. burnettii TaxID=192524 RepID=A0A8H7EYI5_AGABI|nr:hypothetical protein Agabi119p4_8589 [Agaricus bisporus var. burnettii]